MNSPLFVKENRIQQAITAIAENRVDGRKATRMDRLVQFRHLSEAGGLHTMEAMLPLALSLDNKPFTLRDHFFFSPLFRANMPRSSVFLTARQLGKSQSIAARGVMLTGSTPFRIMYLTPLYEQIRRFSTNYVRPLIEQSPIKTLWLGTGTNNSVLQRSFKNGSLMLFTFALLDSSRIRGISVDAISYDESVKTGTMVETPTGSRAVETLSPGDPVISFNENGELDVDEVVNCSDHGVRHCFKFTCADGSTVEATAESWLATTDGWKRVSAVIADAFAATTPSWDDARGRTFSDEANTVSQVSVHARVQTARVQLPKIPGVIGVRRNASQEIEELRLREMVEFLCDADIPSLLPYRLLVSPRREEIRQPGMAGPTDLGGDRLVVPGRRQSAGPRSGNSYGGVFRAGSAAPGQVVEFERDRGGRRGVQESAQPATEILVDLPACRGNVCLSGEDSAIYFPGDGIQDCLAGTTIDGDLYLVWGGVPDVLPGLYCAGAAQLLPATGMPEEATEGAVGSLSCESGYEDKTASCAAGRLLREFGSEPHTGATARGELAEATPGEIQGSQEAIPSQKESRATSQRLDVPAMRGDGKAGQSARDVALLRHVQATRDGREQQSQHSGSQETTAGRERRQNDPVHQLSTTRPGESELGGSPPVLLAEVPVRLLQQATESRLSLQESELVRVEWTGRHRVFDIETKKNSTFIAGGVATHNCQDLDPAHIPIAHEAMSHSKYGVSTFTGTPKSLDNPIHGLWKKSSQAEWVIRCAACTAWNIPSREHHLDAMIGPWREDISEHAPGTICYRCKRPINPRFGHWLHRFPERRFLRAGYHIPQIIAPLHYARQDKWQELVAKREGWGNTSTNVFYNEVLGESVDAGQKLVSETELIRAGRLGWKNNQSSPDKQIMERLSQYRCRVLSVDWGGGGETGTSFTVLALLGYRPDGKIDCLWGKRLVLSQEHLKEAKEIHYWMQRFRADILSHDYTGAGIVRETILAQANLPLERIMPIQYIRTAAQALIRFVPATTMHGRAHYRLDKPRSLLYTCQAIKLGLLSFFEYDSGDSMPGLMGDFLALVEEKTESRLAGDIYTITRNLTLSDDFAHAVNIGCAALWHMFGWPNYAEAAAIAKISQAQIAAAGSASFGWEQDPMMKGGDIFG